MTSPFIHHVSVMNRDHEQSFHFYHKLLGLDFLLKTVNQDDLEMYHLFFGDTTGRPGTEFSVFEVKNGNDKTFGTNSLERTVFAVPSEESITFWHERLEGAGVFTCDIEQYDGRSILRFEDQDGVQLAVMAVPQRDGEAYYGRETDDIPLQHAIYGIHAFHSRVRYSAASVRSLQQLFNVEVARTFVDQQNTVTVVRLKGDTLFDQELHFIEDRHRALEVSGVGAVQHIALNATSYNHLLELEDGLLAKNMYNSGIKDREFFQSIYYREPNSLLIEIATEYTNFTKEPIDMSDFDAIPLMLPEFLEKRRGWIESKLT